MTFLFSGYQQEIQEAKSAFCCSQACSFWLCAFILLFISWFAAGLCGSSVPRPAFSSCSERGCSPPGARRRLPAGAPLGGASGLRRSASVAAAPGLAPRGTWHLRGAGIRPMSSAVAGRSSTLAHEGSLSVFKPCHS